MKHFRQLSYNLSAVNWELVQQKVGIYLSNYSEVSGLGARKKPNHLVIIQGSQRLRGFDHSWAFYRRFNEGRLRNLRAIVRASQFATGARSERHPPSGANDSEMAPQPLESLKMDSEMAAG
jgi:hypothetical protein